jgi:hypothetical protein
MASYFCKVCSDVSCLPIEKKYANKAIHITVITCSQLGQQYVTTGVFQDAVGQPL